MNLLNERNESLKTVFDALEAFAVLGIDYYLIGAIARDVWYAKTGADLRGTKDIDFALLVGSQIEYEAAKVNLKNQHQFLESKHNAVVMIAPSGVQVDILPFGALSIDGHVQIADTGLTSISVDGFQEVLNTGTTGMELETGHHFKVATLPAIVLLKLIAFDDRPEKRYKDARDIAIITGSYFDLQADFIYTAHEDLFKDEGRLGSLSLPEISAIVIGREMKRISGPNIDLLERLIRIVEQHIALAENSAFIQNMVEETRGTVVDMVK